MYVPTVRPLALKSSVRIRAVDPLPLVPVMCTTGHARSGSPSRRQSSVIRSSVGAPNRVGMASS